jgi:hypothetical protein
MNKEFLRMQQLAGLINENQYKNNVIFEGEEAETADKIPDNILAIVAKATKQPAEKVKQIVKQKESSTEDQVDESLTLTSITIAGLIPLAMESIGGLANWISRNTGKNPSQIAQLKKFNEKIEEKEKLIKSLDKKDAKSEMRERELLANLKKQRDDIWGSDFGQWMKEKAHKLHHIYTWPIRTLLKTIGFFTGSKNLKNKEFREKLANILYAITMTGVAGAGILTHLGHLAGVGPVALTIADGVKGGKSVSEIISSIGLAI